MLQESGDLWTWHAEKRWIVITTNIGWRRDGTNPMGAGVARVASEKYPDLSRWYGEKCQKYGSKTPVMPYFEGRFFLFPTKKLNFFQPWLSWKSDADLDLIRKSCRQLVKLADLLTERGDLLIQIGMPLPGCGNGNLTVHQVMPIVTKELDDRFVLLDQR